jgi:hypothetical protein
MMTSNSSDPVSATAESTASAPETAAPNVTENTPAAPEETKSFSDTIIEKGKAKGAGGKKTATAAPTAPVVPAVTTPAEAIAEAAAAYNPNFKFKAFNKEYEVDEWLKPLIKDSEMEDKVKQLLTKTYAFDDYKTRHEGMAGEFQNLLSEHQSLDKDVKRVMNFRNSKDYSNFFASLRIPKEEIFNWVKNELDTEALPPDQRRSLEMQSQERRRLHELEEHNNEMQGLYQEQKTQSRNMQLDMVLARQDVAGIAAAWDQKVGQIGAFRNLVVKEAQNVWFGSGQTRDLSAEEAVQLAVQQFGKFVESQAQQVVTPPAAQGMAPVQQVQGKPVIPAVSGRGSSPVQKMPRSLDDLKQLYKEKSAQGI